MQFVRRSPQVSGAAWHIPRVSSAAGAAPEYRVRPRQVECKIIDSKLEEFIYL
jgi:hypothetical protein